MIRKAFFLFLLVTVMGSYFCYPIFPNERKPLTPDMVGELLKREVTSNRITHIIEERGINFGKIESFSKFLKELKNNGANKNLINAVKREWERITGILVVKAEPHSDVSIDGKHKGLTPVRISLKSGQHHIRIRNSDLKGEWEQSVKIKYNETQTIYHKFETGSLTVNAEPLGIIYVDGERVGETPETLKLAAGNHKIRIVRKGYPDFIVDVIINPGETVFVSPSVGSTFASEKENVLAQVGSYKLTLEKFENQVQSLPPQLQMALLRNPNLKEQFLDRWVDITLIAQEARDRKLDQDPEIQAKIEDIMNAVLAQEFLQREIEGKVRITDDEIETYYKGHMEESSQPESVRARHILLKVPADADEKAWREAESKAMDIKKRLEMGEDFAELAKKYSDDPGSKAKGGELGFFTKGRMVPEFESAVFSLEPGELSDPVKTIFGYHIIQLEEKKQASTKNVSQAPAQIRQTLQKEKQQQLQDELIKKLKVKYPVKVNKDLLAE